MMQPEEEKKNTVQDPDPEPEESAEAEKSTEDLAAEEDAEQAEKEETDW